MNWLNLAGAVILLAVGMASMVEANAAEKELLSKPDEHLEAFVDGAISAYQEQHRIAGVTVAVVSEGNVALLKGYGVSHVEPPKGVDPTESLFRIGSISKTFVWIALMQLQERGLIFLDDPVNDHLPKDLHIPDDGFEEPVRVWHLMTHTAGFEDANVLGFLFIQDSSRLLGLRDYLARYRPKRVRRAGDVTAYSNYGAALAGALVEHVSGLNIEQYAQEHLFRPLGMSSTTFLEQHASNNDGVLPPMSADLASRQVEGIEWQAGSWRAQPRDMVSHLAPSGSVSSTARDMARYMQALIERGTLGEATILEPETFDQMMQVSFRNAPGITGPRHGFISLPVAGGVENIGHLGATGHFMSGMLVVPELQLGVFVSANSAAGAALSRELLLLVAGYEVGIERNVKPVPPMPDNAAIARAARLTGGYRNTRRPYTTIEKLGALPAAVNVSLSPDGHLVTSIGEEQIAWSEIEPLLYQEIGGDRRLAFREGESGAATHVFPGYLVGLSAEKISFIQSQSWFVSIVLITLLTAIGSLFGGWSHPSVGSSFPKRLAAKLLPGLGVLWIASFLLFGFAAVALLGSDLMAPFPSGPMWLSLLLFVICAALTVAAVLSLYPVWMRGQLTLTRKIRYTAAVLVYAAMVLTLNDWNMLGWRYAVL